MWQVGSGCLKPVSSVPHGWQPQGKPTIGLTNEALNLCILKQVSAKQTS